MNKNLFVIPIFALLLSGCSTPNEAKPAEQKPPETPGGLSVSIEKGSLWKSEDGGMSFFPQSAVDDVRRIEKADILSIAYHPTKPASIFVGTVENGIFSTENGGDTWNPITFPLQRIYSFILDKNDPDHRMFASGVLGKKGKIYRTDDAGATWKEIYTEPGEGTIMSVLSQHPVDRNIIFAGTSAGTVVKSTDAGATWKNVGGKIDGIVGDITFDASKKLVTYLLTFGQKLYYSSDGGIRWVDWEEEKQRELQALNDKAAKLSTRGSNKEAERIRKYAQELSKRNEQNRAPEGIISIATDSLRSGTIYAGTATGFYRSTDYGKYWTELNVIESVKQFPIRSIAVNPKNSNEVVFVAGKAFYKSIDGGETWSVTSLRVDRDASFVAYDPFDPKYLFIGLRGK